MNDATPAHALPLGDVVVIASTVAHPTPVLVLAGPFWYDLQDVLWYTILLPSGQKELCYCDSH